jgi:hypothetical protein
VSEGSSGPLFHCVEALTAQVVAPLDGPIDRSPLPSGNDQWLSLSSTGPVPAAANSLVIT